MLLGLTLVAFSWIVATWFYQLLLACAMGAAIGYIAR